MNKYLVLSGNRIPPNWEMHQGLEEATGEKWDQLQCVASEYDGLKKYTRYLKYIFYPFYMLITKRKYKAILTKDQFFGLLLAAYARFFHMKCPDIYVMTFIYKPKKGFIGKLFYKVMSYAVSSPYIKKIFVFGSSEVSYYSEVFGVDKNLFISEILGIKDVASNFHIEDKGYFVAPGRSNRDYAFLRENWNNGELIVVSDMEKKETEEERTREITVRKCFGDDFLSLLAGAKAVIIPLENEHMSSGQLVILQSSMLGVPCIATKNDTVSDYITEETGLIIEKNADSLNNAINKIMNDDIREQYSKAARKRFEDSFSLKQLGIRLGLVVRENS